MEPEVLLLNSLDVYEKLISNKSLSKDIITSLTQDISTILGELNLIIGDSIEYSRKRREATRVSRLQKSGLTVN